MGSRCKIVKRVKRVVRYSRKKNNNPQVPQLVFLIPEKTVGSFAEFVQAPIHYAGLMQMVTLCAQQGDATGMLLIISEYPDDACVALNDAIPANTPIGINSEQTLQQLLTTDSRNASVVYLNRMSYDMLELLAPRLCVGSILVTTQRIAHMVFSWCCEQHREVHAISRATEPDSYAMMFAN